MEKLYYLILLQIIVIMKMYNSNIVAAKTDYKSKYILVLLAICVLSCSEYLHAQRFSERVVVYNPLYESTSKSTVDTTESILWMNEIQTYGSFGAYTGQNGNGTHAWGQHLGVNMELVRFRNEASLSLVSGIEFVADDSSDISFNPRSIWWEEGLLFSKKVGENTVQFGYFHRCKHDIDNLELNIERVLIYSSIVGKYIMPITFKSNTSFVSMLSMRGDIFAVGRDYRILRSTQTNTESLSATPFNNIAGTIGLSYHGRVSLPIQPLGIYWNSYVQASGMSENKAFFKRFLDIDKFLVNGAIEIGIAIEGKSHFRVGMRYERLADGEIVTTDFTTHLFKVGVTILDPSSFW